MLRQIFIAPSINSLFVTGLLVLSIVIISLLHFKQLTNLGFVQKITILSFITIAFGVHGLLHLGLESVYGFNPYKWF